MKNECLSILTIGISPEIYHLLIELQEEAIYVTNIRKISYNREIAESSVLEMEPDLIILEISEEFPVWDFINQIQKLDKQVDFLLISKEKNFEYAYLAIQYHVLNFLLEPLDRMTLIQTLQEASEKMKDFKQMNREREKLDLYELKQHQQLMEKILTNMIEKPEELEKLMIEVNHRYQTDLCNDNFMAIVIVTNRQELYFETTGFCQKVLNFIEHAFLSAHEVVSAVIMPYGITGIINFSSAYENKLDSDIDNLSKEILLLQEEYGEFDIAIGIGSKVHAMKDINLSLQEAFRAEQYKLAVPEKQIFYFSEIPQNTIYSENILPEQQQKTFIRILRSLDEDSLAQWFDQLIQRAEDTLKKYPEGYNQLKEQIINIAKNIWKDTRTDEYFMEEDFSLRQIDHLFEGKKKLELLKKIILSICIKKKSSQNIKISKTIQIALDYINHHFNESIMLEELADICGLSPNYFSHMFKEQVGENYIDYLTEFRLVQAKQLLVSSGKSVKDIGNEIGYLDDKYFRKLFKNRFGVTPSKFRKENTIIK